MNLLNTQQVAERLGVSSIRVRQLIRAGKIEAQNLGRDYAIEESALANVKVYGKPGRPAKQPDNSDQVSVSETAKPKRKTAKKAGKKSVKSEKVKK